MLPALFFLKTALAIWGLLWFQTDFKTICFITMKNVIEILIEIALYVYMAVGLLSQLFQILFCYLISPKVFVLQNECLIM